ARSRLRSDPMTALPAMSGAGAVSSWTGTPPLMPARAGIQLIMRTWVPAFAGTSGLIYFGVGSAAGRFPLTPDVRGQERQGRRRDAVDAARLANGSGPNRIQLLAHFHRQPSHRRVVEAILQLETFVPSVRGNVGSLAVQVDRIFGIDLELLANPGIKRGE